jgi:hypothetical protein
MQHARETHTFLINEDNPQFAEDLRALTGKEFHLVTAHASLQSVKIRHCAQPAGISSQNFS